MKPPTYFVPEENHAAVGDLMDVWRRLDGSSFPCSIVACRPGMRLELGRDRWAQVFRSVHRIPTIGYVLGTTKRRLKQEFSGLEGREIAQLRQQGVEVSSQEDVLEVAFCGDTTIDVLEREEVVRRARVLILEVTFLDDRVSVENARSNGHIHLDEVIERAQLFENQAILFTHFSARYTRADIVKILAERLPDSLRDRVSMLLPEPPWAPAEPST